MSFLSGPEDSAEPAAIQPRGWNLNPAAFASAPLTGFITLVTFNVGGANLTPITNGVPLTKTTNPIAGFVDLIANELMPSSPGTDSWYYDALNAYPGIQWVRWTTGNVATIGSGDFGGMLSVVQGADCTGYFFTAGGAIGNPILLLRYLGGYGAVGVATEAYAPDTAYFAWFNPATGLIELYRGVDNTGVLLISFVDAPLAIPLGTPGIELFNGSIAAWSAGIYIP